MRWSKATTRNATLTRHDSPAFGRAPKFCRAKGTKYGVPAKTHYSQILRPPFVAALIDNSTTSVGRSDQQTKWYGAWLEIPQSVCADSLCQTIKHNQQIQHNHFRKDWQRRVRVHFDQVNPLSCQTRREQRRL